MKISQREARKTKKQLEELRRVLASQRSTWNQEYRGIEIARRTYESSDLPALVKVARRLWHSVVVVGDDSATLSYRALPHPAEPIL